MNTSKLAPLSIRLLTAMIVVSLAPAGASPFSPSTPDSPMPAASPEVEAARASHDQFYTDLRQARQSISQLGRPVPALVEARAGRLDLASLQAQLRGGDPVVNLDSGLGYSSLQAAINAASPADTLQVNQHLAEGPVTVDRDLFVQGMTGVETLTPTQDTGSSGDARGWFLVDAGVALVVRQLRFDGNGFEIHQAFRHRGLGLFDRVAFTDIQFEASGPAYQGIAIVAFGDRVDVVDSTFDQVGRVGALFFGTGVAGALYRGNRYIGKGAGDFLDYGVEANAGASVLVLESSIEACRGVASVDGSTSAAILATTFSGAGTSLATFGTNLADNTTGMAIGVAGTGDSTDASAAFDRFFGNDFGISSVSSDPVEAENNWWGCNTGPGTAGCDTVVVGGAGSIDTDPWLVLERDASTYVKPSRSRSITGDLFENSDGVDVSDLGRVPDGIPGLFFSGPLGSVAPNMTTSVESEWQTFFTAGSVEGNTTVDLTVDNQTVQTLITIEQGLFCDGFESGNTSMWSATAR